MITDQLPAPVRAYLDAADRRDHDAAVVPFAADACVTDEGRTHHGIEAIRTWRHTAASEFTYTTEVTGVRQDSDEVWVVSIHLEGDFPGNVIDLEQIFTVRGGEIAELVI